MALRVVAGAPGSAAAAAVRRAPVAGLQLPALNDRVFETDLESIEGKADVHVENRKSYGEGANLMSHLPCLFGRAGIRQALA